jgi:DNA-binding CsgD family transcriptional regulator
MQPNGSRNPLRELTAREHEILAMLATGASSSEMAEQVGIALPTIKRHIANIYSKLGCNNRVQASNVYHLGDPAGRPRASSRR